MVPLVQDIDNTIKLIKNLLHMLSYADDYSYFPKSDVEFLMVFKRFEYFGKLLGIKINVNKTQAINFQSNIS